MEQAVDRQSGCVPADVQTLVKELEELKKKLIGARKAPSQEPLTDRQFTIKRQ